jgi:hypothetical protein
MDATVIRIGDARLTRVGYVDVLIPPELAGLTAADVSPIDWRYPLWAEAEQLRAGAAAWFAEIAGERIAFDPVQAADNVLRPEPAGEMAQQQAIAQRFAECGFARETIDRLVMTHIEGVGMVAWRSANGSWSPFFPNARILVSDGALAAFLAADDDASNPLLHLQYEAWHALLEAGVVEAYRDGEEIVAGLRAEVTGAHCPGHAILHFGASSDAAGAAGGVGATMVGHLAISPLHLATGECPRQHVEPTRALAALRGCAEDGRLLIGPLWPSPGCGYWRDGRFVAGP